ncbi:hypothetical protein [Janthinobacterium sp. DSP2-3-3]|uniref:hypothetical protein n=1 Tax=unclassified Janthinobacterium TaxID=2610881 RepID=UPI003CE6AF22
MHDTAADDADAGRQTYRPARHPDRAGRVERSAKLGRQGRRRAEISREWNGWLSAEYRSERFRDPGTSAATRAAKAALGDDHGYTMLHLGSSYQLNQRVTLNAGTVRLKARPGFLPRIVLGQQDAHGVGAGGPLSPSF